MFLATERRPRWSVAASWYLIFTIIVDIDRLNTKSTLFVTTFNTSRFLQLYAFMGSS